MELIVFYKGVNALAGLTLETLWRLRQESEYIWNFTCLHYGKNIKQLQHKASVRGAAKPTTIYWWTYSVWYFSPKCKMAVFWNSDDWASGQTISRYTFFALYL